MLKVAIVGAGKAGSALLEMFLANGTVETVGIADRDESAPALAAAREAGIRTTDDLRGLCGLGADIILNVTGDNNVTKQIRQLTPGTEVIEGRGAMFLWDMVQRQHSARKDLGRLYENGLVLTSAKNLNDVLSTTLDKAMELTEMPAGSIALCERNDLRMSVSKGLKESIADLQLWRPRTRGLTSYILSRKEPLAIDDLMGHPLFDNHRLLKEGIRSLLACPLMISGNIVGILYLDDFRPRQFSERDKNVISLFASQAAQAIDKFRILDELYRVVADLDETTAYFMNVLDDSEDMIITTDSRGKIVQFSRGGERILGYKKDEVVGKKASELYVNRDERARVLEAVIRDGAVHNYETRLRRKDGSEADISLTISQLRDKTGKVIGTVGISKDITDEKRLRDDLGRANEGLQELTARLEDKVMERTRELERINKELTQANQIKARFISHMSHELRTPLTSIMGFSEILLDNTFGELNERQHRHVSNIHTSGRHLLHLVNNILDLAKIEAGKVDLSCSDFSVKEAVDEVVMIMHSLSGKKSIQLKVEIDPDVQTFNADKVKFKQILYNLVSNAIKFTPEGGDAGIRVGRTAGSGRALRDVTELEGSLKVTVWDKGIGIKEEDRERVFEEFEQADPSFAKNYQGTGLGLALTKRLVDLHGGQMTVKSAYGEGSEFTFTLPAVLPSAKKEAAREPEPLPMPYPCAEEEAPLVLVVEDDLSTSEVLTIHLSKAGYKVAHAYDGVEAVAKAKELSPFAITLDIMLPKKDGWEVLQALKADPDTRDVPVIIHSIVDNKDLAYALGASDYILKPVDKSVLLSKLGEISLFTKRNLPASALLISEDKETRDYIARTFEGKGFLFHTASGEEKGLELASATRPHMILIDLANCGFELIKKLKGNAATMSIPIFAITDRDLPIEERQNLMGQIERILTKDSIVAQDLIMHLKDIEMLHPKRAGLIDELTGLFNHRYFHLRLAQEICRAARYNIPLTLVLLDIDKFGHYIRAKGYHHGNLVLKKIGELLNRNIRGSDIVVRYGSDAFGVILPNTFIDPGVKLSKRFHAIIRDYPFPAEEVQPKGKITVSIGVAVFRGQTPEELLRCSETALSKALQKGGNSLEVYEDIG
jgi:diguanylate cyclase (GGDEF)-like protein/PAS domain S-box-containing protein